MTNGIVGSRGPIRVAVARDPLQTVPLCGTWRGQPSSFVDIGVSVDIALQAVPGGNRYEHHDPIEARC
jgi:hypothetical protein